MSKIGKALASMAAAMGMARNKSEKFELKNSPVVTGQPGVFHFNEGANAPMGQFCRKGQHRALHNTYRSKYLSREARSAVSQSRLVHLS